MWSKAVQVVILLTFIGCHPYLDHEESLFDSSSGVADFGVRRKLDLLEIKGDRSSLLLIFNQPLRLPGDTSAAPDLHLSLFPETPLLKTEFEGLAGVRLTFERPIPLSSELRVEIPPGWRTPAGVSLRLPIERTWSSERPALASVTSSNSEPAPLTGEVDLEEGKSLLLLFNQPVAPGSVHSALTWERLDAAPSPAPFELTEAEPEEGRAAHTAFVLSPRDGAAGSTYRLALGPGIKGLQGPLRSLRPQEFLVRVPLPLTYLGPNMVSCRDGSVTLKFSHPVLAREVLRCAAPFPSSCLARADLSAEPALSVKLRFEGLGAPRRLTLLAGLEASSGEVLRAPVAIDMTPDAESVSPPKPPLPGYMVCDTLYHRPGEDVCLGGFAYLPKSGEADLEILDSSRKMMASADLSVDTEGFFQARFPSPATVGRYTARVRLAGEAELMEVPFLVCPVAREGESYGLEIENDGALYKGQLSRAGARHREVGVRAYFAPSRSEGPPPGGWSLVDPLAPAWQPLPISGGPLARESFLFSPPAGESGGGEVVVEAFDLRQPNLILARKTIALAATVPDVTLSFEDGDAEQGVQAVKIGVRDPNGETSRDAELQASLFYRAGDNSPWEQIDARTFTTEGEQESWQMRFHQKGDYRLEVRGQTRDSRFAKSWQRALGATPSPWASASTPVAKAGQAQISMKVSRQDGIEAMARAGQSLAVELQAPNSGSRWNGDLMWRRRVPGWAENSAAPLDVLRRPVASLSLRPEGYPLLDPTLGPQSDLVSGIHPDPEAVLEILAPSDPGEYLYTFFGRDARGQVGSTEASKEVGETTRWVSRTPWCVRANDSFRAGIAFISGPVETGTIGLTAEALLEGALAPTGYVATAGVAKPGATVFLPFSYLLGETAAKVSKRALALSWELGHSGAVHTVLAQVPIVGAASVPRSARPSSTLASGETDRIAVPGPLPWRLQIHAPETGADEAILSLQGPHGSLGKVRLRAGMKALSFQGAGPGTVSVHHLAGPPVSYEMVRLEPDVGDTAPWGSRLYLLRQLVDENGAPLEYATMGKKARMLVTLVAPLPLDLVEVHLPLPGGVRPLAVEAALEGTKPPADWKSGEGEVSFSLEDLAPGEYAWTVDLDVLASGDYLWPTARVTASGDRLLALSGSRRLRVLEK